METMQREHDRLVKNASYKSTISEVEKALQQLRAARDAIRDGMSSIMTTTYLDNIS